MKELPRNALRLRMASVPFNPAAFTPAGLSTQREISKITTIMKYNKNCILVIYNIDTDIVSSLSHGHNIFIL